MIYFFQQTVNLVIESNCEAGEIQKNLDQQIKHQSDNKIIELTYSEQEFVHPYSYISVTVVASCDDKIEFDTLLKKVFMPKEYEMFSIISNDYL